MKKLLLILLLPLFLFSQEDQEIDERKVDFYFGNGLWNTIDKANINKEELQKFLLKHLNITTEVKLAFNQSDGLFDVDEMKYQMVQEGYVGVHTQGFFTPIEYSDADSEFYKRLIDLYNRLHWYYYYLKETEAETLDEMVKAYQESINSGHKVVLVSHSQGNLFGVRAYDRLKSWQKKYFKQISVGSVASRVAGGGEYVTLDNDKLVWDSFEALPPNAINNNTKLIGTTFHHGFADEYLNGDVTSGMIAKMLHNAYTSSLAAPSQWRPVGNETCSTDGCDAFVFMQKFEI